MQLWDARLSATHSKTFDYPPHICTPEETFAVVGALKDVPSSEFRTSFRASQLAPTRLRAILTNPPLYFAGSCVHDGDVGGA